MNRKRKGYCPDLCCHCCVLCLTAYTANDSQHNTRMFLWRAPATSVPPAHSPSIGFLTSTLSQIVRFIELKQWYERVFFFFFTCVLFRVIKAVLSFPFLDPHVLSRAGPCARASLSQTFLSVNWAAEQTLPGLPNKATSVNLLERGPGKHSGIIPRLCPVFFLLAIKPLA